MEQEKSRHCNGYEWDYRVAQTERTVEPPGTAEGLINMDYEKHTKAVDDPARPLS